MVYIRVYVLNKPLAPHEMDDSHRLQFEDSVYSTSARCIITKFRFEYLHNCARCTHTAHTRSLTVSQSLSISLFNSLSCLSCEVAIATVGLSCVIFLPQRAVVFHKEQSKYNIFNPHHLLAARHEIMNTTAIE
jgi:hypothetical protein